MKKYHLGYLFFVISQLVFSWPAVSAAPIKPSSDWAGFYLGTKAGAVFAHFDTKTSTQAGPLLDPVRANAVNKVGSQKIDKAGFLSGLEGGYNWLFNRFLIGVETDIQSLSINGETNSGAVPYSNSSGQFVVTSYGNNNWLFTAKPRLGFIVNHWLFYATGGLGLALLQSDFIFSDNSGALESKRVSKVKPGYVLGAGLETNLTKHISLKTEYLFGKFNNTKAFNMNHNLPTNQTFSNTVNLKSNILTLGLNYHFNAQSSYLLLISELFDVNQWDAEVGARLFFSSGLDGAPQPLLNSSNIGNLLASRLTFSGLSAISEEAFARINHSSGVFVKGYLGAGSVTKGRLNDEDFPAFIAYSNTLSNIRGNLSYATIDFGYTFLKNLFGSIGAFIGYNYYAQNLGAYSCTQLADSIVCIPSSELTNFLGITEDDKFNSLRLGLSSQFSLTNKLTLTSEAAYLPFVNFRGQDIHNARELIGPEHSSRGDGAMLEAILNYRINNAWNMGLGGRYWMWNMHNGNVIFDFLGEAGSITEPARFNAERYGAFLQVNYHNEKSNYLNHWSAPITWQGIFIGWNLGGSWGKSNWSDPFGSTHASQSRVNVAGFGDQIRLAGPLTGIDLGINWQAGRLVYGIDTSIQAADSRGENTLFSGIGGVNGQMIVNYLGTIVGKVGTTFNRSFLYVNAGRAALNTKYSLNSNTSILTLGTESKTMTTWGWTGGLGVEYAFNDHWTTSIEYNYISIPRHSISFPAVELIDAHRISANQRMNVFKLGFNYRFDTLKMAT